MFLKRLQGFVNVAISGGAKMKKTNAVVFLAVGSSVLVCGCGAKRAETTGFLSDYSRLKAHSDVSYRHVPSPATLRRYSKFIVDPVDVHFHAGSKAIEQRSKGKLKEEDIRDLRNYMHAALVKALSDRYQVVYRPGPGVARLRVALTDLKKSKVAQNILPQTKLLGTGLGGASMEVELLDSQTGQQIAAVVESQLGKRLSLEGVSKWGDVKSVMDDWAKRFRKLLDEAHG